jgi:glycosyltransferase involved in cell wall biosynthesis
MVKVVHLTSAHPTQDVRIFYKQCRSLQQAGYEVAIIGQSEKDYLQDNIQIYSIPKIRSRFKRMAIIPWKIYWKAIKIDAAVYHFHDPELIPIGLLLRFHGKRVIYDVHEDLPRDVLLKSWLPRFIRSPLGCLLGAIEYLASKFFDHVVTVTPHISQRFSHTRVTEVRNYPIITDFLMPNPQQPFLCYAGLLTVQRGLHEMMQVAEATNTPLLLAGRKNKTISISSGAKQVTYLGNLDPATLASVYSQSFAGFALLHPGPTFNLALPIKLFEYMAAGIPVIASNFDLWRDIIEKHDCGFCIDPFDIEGICEKVNFLKLNPEVAREMGQRGRDAVKLHYNWEGEARKLIAVYGSLANFIPSSVS